MNKILIIDDDRELCALIKRSVQSEHIEADFCNTGKEGLQKLKEQEYQLVVLDVMMPGMDGFETLEEIRKENSLPILMFTSKNDSISKVRGLRAGADDYLTKPFDMDELIARIASLIRRYTRFNHQAGAVQKLDFDGLQIDLENRSVTTENGTFELPPKEFDLLLYCAKHQGKILTKQQIYAFFLADVNTDVDAVNGVMSSLFQLSAYLLLMPLLVILASNLLFEELDNDTLKNLVTIPINRTKLVLSKMLVLLLFAVGFMAVGGLVNLAVLLFQGWEPVGFWTLFGVGIEEGLIMWVGALPCILLVVLLNKNYIVSVVITFFYTTANYILSMSDAFLTQPFGLNIGTLFPGPLAFRWTFQFYDQSQTSAELADLLERISPYFLNGVQVFGVIVGEAVVFLALIALVYRRQEI